MLTKSYFCCTRFKRPRIFISVPEEPHDLYTLSDNGYKSFNSLFEPTTTVSTSDCSKSAIGSGTLTISVALSGYDCERRHFKSNNPLFDKVDEVNGSGSESEPDMKAVRNSTSTQSCLGDSETLIGSLSSSGSESDIAAAVARRRFFLASPGNTNSIVDPAAETRESVSPELVAVETSSSDPFIDFRQSMEETAEALGLFDGSELRCWELQELLLCYLALNGKNAHAYILDAFVDLFRRSDDAAEV